jgi:hypothetical protein
MAGVAGLVTVLGPMVAAAATRPFRERGRRLESCCAKAKTVKDTASTVIDRFSTT